jgi:hypothetical protein
MAKIPDDSFGAWAAEATDNPLTGTAAGQVGMPLTGSPRKVMVIVHGAGSFPDDYYKPLVAAIEQRLGGTFNFIPVYYADITNPHSPSITAQVAPTDPAAADFAQAMLDEMERTHAAAQQSSREAGVTALSAEPQNLITISLVRVIVREVGEYLFTYSISARIQERLIAVLDQAVQQYDEIVLASLSLGTLVTFDALALTANRYKISSWFTAGSPLAMLRRLGVRQSDLGAINPANVARWLNLYDTNDVIASPIGPQFPDYRLYDVYVSVGNNPLTAHDYFNNGETLDLLADAMR